MKLCRNSASGEKATAAVMVQVPVPENNVALESAAQGATQDELLDTPMRQRKAIVGSWLQTVTIVAGPTFKSVVTYTEDGTFVASDQGSVITEPPFPHVFSSLQGVWVHQGGRTFSTTGLQLISDLNGGLLFINKVRQTITLNETRDAFSVVWKAEFTDPNGNLINTFEGTIEGERIKNEPLP